MYGAVCVALVAMPYRGPGKRKLKGMLACYGIAKDKHRITSFNVKVIKSHLE